MSKETGLFEEIGDAVKPEGKKIVPKKKPAIKAITVKLKQEIVKQSETAALLKLAIDKDLDIGKLEKLIDLKNREDEKIGKKEFDNHFAQIQAKFPPVKRSKEGYGYNYTPLEVMQKSHNPIIAEFGFSYKWKEVSLPEGGKKVILIINGYGYTDEETSFDIPKLEATKQQNAVQVLGSMSTYGKRYTFVSGFGITIEDEDDDAAALTFADGVQYAQQVQWIESCETKEDLVKTWKEVWTQLGTDKLGKDILTVIYNKQKKVIK